MENVVWSCNDYSIYRVGLDRLYDIASFVVTENYNHHSSGTLPHTISQEIEAVYNEELSYSKDSLYFIAQDRSGRLIGCIRVFKWDKQTPTPMQKVFNISPLEKINSTSDSNFWHIGRFAIGSSTEFPTIKMFKQLMTLAVTPILQDDNGYMIAETDSHLLRVMNILGIETRQIGEPLIYLASETIPVYSNKQGLTRFYQKSYPLLTAS